MGPAATISAVGSIGGRNALRRTTPSHLENDALRRSVEPTIKTGRLEKPLVRSGLS